MAALEAEKFLSFKCQKKYYLLVYFIAKHVAIELLNSGYEV